MRDSKTTPRHSYSETNELAIIELIKKYPGLGLRELARELNTSPQSLKYYTDQLITENAIEVKKDGKYLRFYDKNFHIEAFEQTILNCIRKAPLLNVIMVFLNAKKRDGKDILKNNEVMDQLDVQSAGTVTYYLNQLIECSIIEKNKEGFRLINPSLIQHLINKYTPTKSIIDNFIQLWEDYFSL